MSCRVLIFKIIMVVVFWRTIIIIAYKESTGAYNNVYVRILIMVKGNIFFSNQRKRRGIPNLGRKCILYENDTVRY